jgi:23S rRNA (guanosine2251-2'-O)-methyltransferase
MTHDSPEYQRKKSFFDQLLTIYGRKPVLEALQDNSINIFKLHLADSNKRGGIVAEILQLAEQRSIEVQWHDRKSLSRISRNSKQDQGVAADLELSHYQSVEQFLHKRTSSTPFKLIALDSITNPQNLGMIIRSVCAGYVDGLILPKRGCAALSPLVIKASVGSIFKARILHCEKLAPTLAQLKEHNTEICTLSSHAKASLFDARDNGQSQVYVLGNETEGVSKEIAALSDKNLSIPMNNGVESLNVAVTAALIAFNRH